MIQAEELLREGRLPEALADLQNRIRQDPASVHLRVFLFQLLCVLGDWKRAMTQSNVAADLDADCRIMAQVYRPVLHCEALRAAVFAGQRLPVVFGDPLEWVSWMIEANRLSAQGHVQAADDLRAQALEAAPAVPGEIDGRPFAWLGDADPRLGPLLELIVEGRYFWAPLQRLHEIRIEAPTDLRDRVWLPVTCVWSNGGTAAGLMPVRYPGSEQSADGAIALARKTEWAENGLPSGQRMWATDQGEYALLDTRRIVLQPQED
jgi:type VI secretion system protein ImpE